MYGVASHFFTEDIVRILNPIIFLRGSLPSGLKLIIVYLLYMVVVGLFVSCLYTVFKTKNKNTTLLSSQNSLSVSDDMFLIVISSLLLIFIYVVLQTSYTYVHLYDNLIYLVDLVVCYHTILALQIGLFFVAYIKGAGQSASCLYNVGNDYMNILSFSIRFYIQFVRLVLIYVTFNFLDVLILESYMNLLFFSYSSSTALYLHVIFEYAHFWFLVVLQISIFCFFFLWLFSFLVSCFSIFHKN